MKLLLCFFTAGLVSFASAQVFPYRHYSTHNGLPHSNVFCMQQDMQGFIWLGTENGLSRFDGREFTNYSAEEGLSSNEVTALACTKDGNRIWLGLYDHTLDYMEDGQIHNYRLSPYAVTLFHNLVELNGWLYSGLQKELRTMRDNKVYQYKTTKSTGGIQYLFAVGDSLLLGMDSGCFLFRNGQFKLLLKAPVVKCMSIDTAANLWLGIKGGLLCLNLKQGKVVQAIDLGPDYLCDRVFCDSYGRLWVWAVSEKNGNSLFMLDSRNKYPVGKHLGIDQVQINFIREDGQKNIWIGTFGNGVYCLYNFFIRNYTTKEGLTNNYIFSLAKDLQGNLLAGSYRGLNMIDRNGHIRQQESVFYPALTYRTVYAADNSHIYAAGTSHFREHVHTTQISTGKIVYCASRCMLLSRDTLLLGGWGNELEFYKKRGETFSFLRVGLLFRRPKGHVGINCLYKQGTDTIWAGSNKGLCYLLNGKAPIHEPITKKPAYISDIKMSPSGTLWIATRQGVFLRKGKSWERLTAGKQYFLLATSLAFDRNGRAWIGTLNGLFLYHHGRVLQHMNRNSGLLSGNINVLFCDTSSDLLWIGSSEGLSCLETTTLNAAEGKRYPLCILRLNYAGSSYRDIHRLPPVPYKERDLQIYFSQPEFRYPYRITYQYWFADQPAVKYTTTQPSIRFASMKPGNYTLFISTPDSFVPPVSVMFVVAEPFWSTWPFLLLSFTLGGSLLTWGMRRRVSHIRRQEEQKRITAAEMNRLKHQAMAAAMNPHFIFNCLSTVQHFINSNQPYEANEYLASFGRLIRINLDVADRSSIPLAEELGRLEQYLFLEKKRFGKKLSYTITVDESLNTQQLQVPNMLLQPFAENAIKHGLLPAKRDGSLQVRVTRHSSDHLRIIIEDDGIGLQASRGKHNGHLPQGIHLVEERLKLLLKDLYQPIQLNELSDANGNAYGTRVELLLPLQPLAGSAEPLPRQL